MGGILSRAGRRGSTMGWGGFKGFDFILQICNFTGIIKRSSCFMDNDDLYFDGKYRIPSARLKGWDYRTSADYYITICTRDMVP
jgi:hypothetical protein